MEKEFDKALGGTEVVPSKISVKVFAEARCQELSALNKALEQAQKGGLIFQRLPLAMRRRVMSSNTKRMPRRLQLAHAKQIEKNGVFPSSKRPSRKFKRRPENLLTEYNRRQKNYTWLETHIWHAKRFHMTEKWGYKLGNFTNAKTYRACFRASANHCLIQDISYYCCIEINGPEKEIIEGLRAYVNEKCGLTFAAKAFMSGKREGSVTMFHKDCYPFQTIGTVRFLWKTEEKDYRGLRTMWLWVHPAIYSEILEILVQAFKLCKETKSSTSSLLHSDELKKLEARHIFDAPETYIDITREITVICLKDRLNRFRLTGPLSHVALVDALNVISASEDNSGIQGKDIEILHSDLGNDHVETISENQNAWWESFYLSNKDNQKILSEQKKFWWNIRNIYSPSQLHPHQVIALTVLDPRYQLPPKRTKSVPEPGGIDDLKLLCDISANISCSPIWNSDIRSQSSSSKLTSSELSKLRSSQLVPGVSKEEINTSISVNKAASLEVKPSYIPVLLIQRPGSQDATIKRLGFGSGWDVVMPVGWAMPFWIALNFRGAKPGGLKETSSLSFESGAMENFEIFAPDTCAGRTEEADKEKFRRRQHFSKPPNNRPNFIKLGVVSPFSCCWDILINDWCQNKQDPDKSFYVLRDHVKLDALKKIVNSKRCDTNSYGSWSDMISQCSSIFSNVNHNFLVPVRIESLKKGCPVDCSMICIPSSEDIQSLNNNEGDAPVEPMHSDHNDEKRKTLKNLHQKKLKRLKKQRKQDKIKLQGQMEDLLEQGESIKHLLGNKKNHNPTKEIVDEHDKEMKLLWVPPTKTVKDSCSRTIAGFVFKGDFSLTESSGVGLGYVPFPALINLINVWTTKQLVLFRNPNSVNYRFALIKIC